MRHALFTVVYLVLFSGAGCVTHQAQTPREPSPASNENATNSFALYLLDPVSYTNNWSNTRLKSPPIITDSDIVAVDLTNLMIKLKPGVFERLPAPGIDGVVFVCVADGARLFPGVFWNNYSSYSPPANALIIMEPPPLVKDCLDLEYWGVEEPNARALRTELPWEQHIPTCPWSDSRLRNCLEKLHKLKQVKYP
jgi:hypothetical protein